MTTESIDQLIPDVPKGGPLEYYRKKASFNWKQMKLFFDDVDLIPYRNKIWQTLRKDPLFAKQIGDISVKDKKDLTGKRVKRLAEYAFLTKDELYSNPLHRLYFDEALFLWDIDASIKYSLHYQMFQELIAQMGTERHQPFIEKCDNYEISGCFCMTEISHGSNTRELKTTATYDPNTQEFVINTPTIEDSKIWVGNLGKVATHAAVYAQLYTSDGVNHGLHIFITPIRDPYTMYALPGVFVGDMGPKAGLNGIDNGFVTFHNVRIPRENLLNKTGDVTPDGRYVTPYKDPNKRFGVSLGALSNGRVGLTFFANCFMSSALTIAVRYGAVRRQFGAVPGEEIPIIEYQLHQYRLMPSLALCFVWRHFSKSFFMNLAEFVMRLMGNDNTESQSELGREIHAISCVSKPLSSWTAQAIIQECREACGGHGYLAASRFVEFRNNNDPLLTFEGDNNVLLQQTSNYLLSMYEEYLKSKTVPVTPLSSLQFFKQFEKLSNTKFTAQTSDELLQPQVIMQLFDWLVCHLIKVSYERVDEKLRNGKDSFTARNDSQVFYLKTLSLVFMERLLIARFIERLSENTDPSLQPALNRILYLAALHCLEKYTTLFYENGVFSGPKPSALIRETIIQLCNELKNEALGLIDAIAVPDYVLDSALGDSTGNVYKKLYNTMIQTPGCFDRLSHYNDFMDKKEFGHLRSKL